MAKKDKSAHVSETPATQMLRARGVAFTEHPYDYVEHGGTEESARQLGLDEQRLTFHVLEAPDTAAAIVEFASKNQVDHIVMGARGNSALRRYLGSVSAQVVAEADCSVTVVRV